MHSNKFTGTIPQNLRFRKIKFADLGDNQFHGTLPDDIGERWVQLRFLYLDHNQFTGTIPDSYPTTGNSRVEAMTFNHNSLTGKVPGKFTNNKLRKSILLRKRMSRKDVGDVQVFSDWPVFASLIFLKRNLRPNCTKQWNSTSKTIYLQILIRKYANNRCSLEVKWLSSRRIVTFVNANHIASSSVGWKQKRPNFNWETNRSMTFLE